MGKERMTMSGGNIGAARRVQNIAVDTSSSQTSSIQSTTNVESTNTIPSSPLGIPSPTSVPRFPLDTTPAPSDSAPAPTETAPSLPQKRKGEKSEVWQYFTRHEDDENKCKCNICGIPGLPCDLRKNGTSSIWSHIYKKCVNHPLRKKQMLEVASSQSHLVLDNISGAKVHKYSKQRMDAKCIAMIIKDELSFRFVEKEGFRDLMREAIPQWPCLNRKQVAKGIIDLYNTERTLLKTSLGAANRRVSITTDTWTSIQNINYMVLTAHFMDDDWKLHKRIINFCPITSHKGDDIGRAVEACLSQWELKRIFTITVDNASANDVAVQFIKRRLNVFKTLAFDGQYIHLRCACHIINLIVKDGLKELEGGISAITNCVKYIRSSPARLDKFRSFASSLGLGEKAIIPLDVVTRWNSTYMMLEAALKYENVFALMADDDASFRSYFTDKGAPPSFEDWKYAAAFCKFLGKFYDSTNNLSAWKSVTSHILLKEMVGLQSEIAEACKSGDEVFRRVGMSMREKFNKYWGSFGQINKLVMIANILDPRCKLKVVRLAMLRAGADLEDISAMENELKSCLMAMYEEYKADIGVENDGDGDNLELDDDDLEGLDPISLELARQSVVDEHVLINNEVDQYLSDKCISFKLKGFEIVKYWRGCETNYPILSRLAKDILAIPCSTVASENSFSLGSRIVDPFRSCLTSKMVEALVCTSDWLRASPINLYNTPSADDMELYEELEEIETEIAGAGQGCAASAMNLD